MESFLSFTKGETISKIKLPTPPGNFIFVTLGLFFCSPFFFWSMIPKEFHGENEGFFLMPGLYVGFRPWSKALPPHSAMSRHLFWERKGDTSQAGNI